MEGGERGQDGSSNPDGIFAFRWGDDFDFHCGWSQSGDFLLHSVRNSGVHGGAAREDSVGVQVLTDIDIALHDGIVGSLMDAG